MPDDDRYRTNITFLDAYPELDARASLGESSRSQGKWRAVVSKEDLILIDTEQLKKELVFNAIDGTLKAWLFSKKPAVSVLVLET